MENLEEKFRDNEARMRSSNIYLLRDPKGEERENRREIKS